MFRVFVGAWFDLLGCFVSPIFPFPDFHTSNFSEVGL